MRKYDAVVVGAGPAGSMAAYEIACAGYSVLLLEKHDRPGMPLCCAEGIAAEAMKELFDAIEPSWISTEIDRVIMVAPNGNRAEIPSERRGFILDRPRLDYDLAQRARKAGAELVCRAIGRNLVQSRRRFATIDIGYPGGKEETIEAGIFIAADGVESQVARNSGIPNRLTLKDSLAAYQHRVTGVKIDPLTIEFHFDRHIAPLGYIWIFPKSSSSANVGICMAAHKHKIGAAAAVLDEFIKKRFDGAKIVGRHCGLIPLYQGEHTMRKANLLVVGDAARIIESLSGAGLALGMTSGIYAGRAAAKFLSGKVTRMADLDKAYPGDFLRRKKAEMVRYARMRRAYEHMTDNDCNYIIAALKDFVHEQSNDGKNVGKLLWMILKTHPKLLRLARFLV